MVTGGLIISSPARRATTHVPDFFENTLAAARRFGIEHEMLDAREMRELFPQFNVSDNEVGYYEPGAGYPAARGVRRARSLRSPPSSARNCTATSGCSTSRSAEAPSPCAPTAASTARAS